MNPLGVGNVTLSTAAPCIRSHYAVLANSEADKLHIFDCTEMHDGPWVEDAMDNSAKPPPAARRQSNVLQYKELLKTKEANEGTHLIPIVMETSSLK